MANHQVRNLRTLLVEDTVNFEQHLFLQRIRGGQLDVLGAQSWYAQARRHYARLSPLVPLNGPSSSNSNNNFAVAALVHGLVTHLASYGTGGLPDVFESDRDRLSGLRAELHSVVMVDVCIKSFELFAYEYFQHDEPIPPRTMQTLRSRLLSLLDTPTCIGTQFHPSCSYFYPDSCSQRTEELALEMARVASQLLSTRTDDDEQCFFDPDVIASMTHRLRGYLTLNSALWQHQEDLATRLVAEQAISQTLVYLDQSLIVTAESAAAAAAATAQVVIQAARATTQGERATITPASSLKSNGTDQSSCSPPSSASFSEILLIDIARRLAHVASLHWRVFGPLVYLRPADEIRTTRGLLPPSSSSPLRQQLTVKRTDDMPIAGKGRRVF